MCDKLYSIIRHFCTINDDTSGAVGIKGIIMYKSYEMPTLGANIIG